MDGERWAVLHGEEILFLSCIANIKKGAREEGKEAECHNGDTSGSEQTTADGEPNAPHYGELRGVRVVYHIYL